MGQTVSVPLTDTVGRVRDNLMRRAAPLQEVSTIPYEQLLQHVDELNALCAELGDDGGRRLRFCVDEASAASPFIWRGTLRVLCQKVGADGEPESTRALSLRQFLQARATLAQQHAWLAAAPRAQLGAAALNASRLLDQLDADDGCCCICLERAPDATLPCAHAYCTVCIERWNPAHKTCPMCRQGVESTDEAWVMPDAPSSSQLRQDLASSVLSLATDQR